MHTFDRRRAARITIDVPADTGANAAKLTVHLEQDGHRVVAADSCGNPTPDAAHVFSCALVGLFEIIGGRGAPTGATRH